MTKTITSICLLIVFFWQPTSLTARDFFPLETLYAQTDKQNYFTGENIWFRAFLVNSQTFELSAMSRYVYAELINSRGEVKNRVMIRHENGVFAGHIPVTEDLEAGSYILRFFTRHLENFGEEYFFQRVIHIITPQSLEKEQTAITFVANNDFAVSFHPEGGDIPAGVYTRIAFKAINSSGLGEDICGTVVNESGNIVTELKSTHRGMGYFLLAANSNERMFANVRNAAGVERRFELPRAREDAISLQITRQDEYVIVYLLNSDNRVLYLTLLHRGYIIYSERWNNSREVLIIPEDNLPTGVIGFVLSDARNVPISKRQIFNKSALDIVNTSFTTANDTHGARERVNATISITDIANRPIIANFSISVIDSDIAQYDASVNILSTLLLTSDLRGHIETPAYYFMSDSESAQEHLDLVMLTHGWSRFDVSRIYQKENISWQDFETSLSITGSLQGSLVRRRANQPVTLIALELNFFNTTYTDNEGRFQFENFEFPENTEFIIQGSTGTIVHIDERTFPAVTNLFIPTEINNVSVFDSEQIEGIRQFMPDDDIWSMYLDELVVTAGRPETRTPRTHPFSSPLNRRLEREDLGLSRYHAPNMFLLVRNVVPGLVETDEGGLVFYRTQISPLLRTEEPDKEELERGDGVPLIFLDGTEIATEFLESLPADIVESIEFISTRQATEFGMRAFGGVIMITTTGEPTRSTNFPNITVITPLGYQVTREFFAPVYTTEEQRASTRADFRTTIYWNPSVTTGETGSADIHFYTSDHVGNYVVIIEGITDEGGIVHMMGRIR